MLKKIAILITLFSTFVSVTFAGGDIEQGKEKAATCVACHGVKGISTGGINPNLAGQIPGYIATQLKAFKSGERKNAVMMGMSMGLSEDTMNDLDAYYSSLKPQAAQVLSDSEKEMAKEGEKIYRGGVKERSIASCMSCHGPSGNGIPKNYPKVSGQHASYLESQLLAFKKGTRVGYKSMMSDIAFGLSEEQIKQLSLYMSSISE